MVHSTILKIPGIVDLIQRYNETTGSIDENPGQAMGVHSSSELASSLFDKARYYQTQASGPRLAQAPVAYSRPGLPGIRSMKNLERAQQVVAERKLKAEELKYHDTGIHITAFLWESSDNKIVQVSF